MVVTALDEIAWLLNIRGYDIPYNPLVLAYVIVSHEEINMYANESRLSIDVLFIKEIFKFFFEKFRQLFSAVPSKLQPAGHIQSANAFSVARLIQMILLSFFWFAF